MKLTQKTLFQCFEKSRSSTTPLTNPTTSIRSSESQVKPTIYQNESNVRQLNFMLPIHIRQEQEDKTSYNDTIPCVNERELNDDNQTCSREEFYRICPTIVNNENLFPKIEFVKICSTERQMELFAEYTNNDDSIDWKSMFDIFQDNRTKLIDQNQYEQLQWTDIYRPKNSKSYLGNHTCQIKRLNEWFSYWTKKLQNEQPKNLKNSQRKRKRINDDDYSDENFSNDSSMFFDSGSRLKPEHPQLIFVHGCGTTSLVHALTEEHNFKVTEINGSQTRARTPLLKQLEQVTNHHQLSFKRCPSDTPMSQRDNKSTPIKEVLSPLPAKKKAKNERNSIASYFNQSKKSIPNDDEQKENDSQCQLKPTISDKKELKNLTKRRSKTKQEPLPMILPDSQFLSSVQVEKTSLILFDEIETLTTDDNFWSCLKKILEATKKPIILTSNSRTNPEDAIINLSKLAHYELIHLEPIEQEVICCFLRLILLIEMLEVPSLDELKKLVQFCSNDLRQILITLQFLAQSSTIKNNENSSLQEENNSILSKPKWQSSRIFDAMYYSNLGEHWNESSSSLKIFFDDLTVKYTSDYRQSHLLLLDRSKHDTKRIELYDTFKLFMQEQEFDNIVDHPSFYLDYRPYIRQICQNEHHRMNDGNSNRRLRHSLTFRGCSLQWSDFEILSAGID